MNHDFVWIASVGALGLVSGFLLWSASRYGVTFYRELRGSRRRGVLLSALLFVVIIVNTLVGVFSDRGAPLTRPPKPSAARAPTSQPSAAQAPTSQPSAAQAPTSEPSAARAPTR